MTEEQIIKDGCCFLSKFKQFNAMAMENINEPPQGKPCGIFKRCIGLNGGSFCKEIYNTVWFNTRTFAGVALLEPRQVAGY